eukprot:gnl/TRDRNA2_/TRDRNA2_187837_c0_seq1.p1 gnl/TRDRNA2_/TRDRNA2_187837_c0~~gnl/TRDRNA2_/TRDRNA2_187837_c0_seq1.p1  ORF type:complete len:552 (+),score=153.06 gnl/TRDRNA2_/TRDRNA2_187837_c0_seq1:89-1744(+)
MPTAAPSPIVPSATRGPGPASRTAPSTKMPSAKRRPGPDFEGRLQRREMLSAGLAAADLDREIAVVKQDADKAEKQAQHFATVHVSEVQELQNKAREQEELAAKLAAQRDAAKDKVQDLRQLAGKHIQHFSDAQDRTNHATKLALETARTMTTNTLWSEKQKREQLVSKYRAGISARERDSKEHIDRIDAQSRAETLRCEVARHRAAMAIDAANARASASKVFSSQKIESNYKMAAEQVKELTEMGQNMEASCSELLDDMLATSAIELEETREYCDAIKDQTKKELAQYKQRMGNIEHEAKLNAKEIERQIMLLDQQRLSEYNTAFQSVEGAQEQSQVWRKTCEAEIDGVHGRLDEVDCQARARQILDQWLAGNKQSGERVRQMELNAQRTLEAMQEAVSLKLQQCNEAKAAIQKQSTEDIVALERKGNQIVEATQPSIDDARRADEAAARYALEKWEETHKVPAKHHQAADAAIAQVAEWAMVEEARLIKEAEVAVAAAKAAARASLAEEERLRAETSAAWARLRAGCYQLRLMNLHDFAQGITAGKFDL